MLRPLPEWKEMVTLVPSSGIQFLDFAFDLEQTKRLTRSFIERRDKTRAGPDGQDFLELIPLSGAPEADEAVINAGTSDDDLYDIGKSKALEPFLGKWVPIPFLRRRPGRGSKGEELFDVGPTSWARVLVQPVTHTEDGRRLTHRVVLAFDTELAPRIDGHPYLVPSIRDAEDEQEFKLATAADDMRWFLAWPDPAAFEGQDPQAWVDDWLRELFQEFKEASRPGRTWSFETAEHKLEHWARYLTFLELLDDAIHPPRIKLLDTVSAERRYAPVQVDLVLDVGNSRTCGILIEHYPDSAIDLNDSFVLQLRDLSHPWEVYAEPFESRVEFAHAVFGKDHLARRAGRARAFFWPSLVRVGPEAMRFVGEAEGNQITTGLSSPKRYLWSTEPVTQEWRFQACDYTKANEEPGIARAVRRFLTERGEPIRQIAAEEKNRLRQRSSDGRQAAMRTRFSRSSLYGFMLSEIICQALMMINDPGVRAKHKQTDLPRRLRQVIITLPPATPLSEQRIMRSRAEGAVKLIWDLMGWTQNERLSAAEPRIVIRWDEASCTHLVWLYTEITQKFGGQAREFVQLLGRERAFCDRPENPPPANAPLEPSLRIASVDIGGGTTDLMITTYYVVDNLALKPTQNFREGFRIAGDDVLEAVVARIVLPAIQRRLEACGLSSASSLMQELFAGNRAQMSVQQKLQRRLFVIRACIPIALKLLQSLEDASDGFADEPPVERPFGWFFGLENGTERPVGQIVGERIAAYVEDSARAEGASGFRLTDVMIPIDLARIDEIVRSVLRAVIGHMAEAIHALDCDVLLLTGRPSRLSTVANLFTELLCITPHRIVPMHRYRTGIWYPFRSRDNARISDPKTTAVVGGMLCTLAESQIPNFMLMASRLLLRSTARFIGAMDTRGDIRDENLLFKDIDLDARARLAPASAQVRLYAPMQIGFRQLPLERWTATPLYRLEATNPQAFARMERPFSVTLDRTNVEFEVDEQSTDDQRAQAEASREDFKVTEVVDGRGDQLKPGDVVLRLHTLGLRDAYWLDTGILPLP